MDVKLVMFKSDGQRKDFRIHKDKTILGRGSDCDLRVPLLNVSRKHCELLLGAGKLKLRDLTSSNGTYVNNRRVNEAPLRPGDRIAVGPVIFTVQIDGVPAEIAPLPSKSVHAAVADDVVDLEADILEPLNTDGEDSDPMAALDAALADLADDDEDRK
ncbi:MAG TPA: FHA domain-containing protein [Phycisphaerae bacterium]|nr:FHA domain-containing protein [Phycisphaerae bacterium]HUU22836.1 FHA domain-containing protein [Phycisphaerae bacterium]